MAKVTLHHYNWDLGRNDRDQHFDITFMPKDEVVQNAWKNKLYSPVVEMSATDEVNHLDVCEDMFHAENMDAPRNRRSMCVGDVVQINTKFYLCASMGFREIQFT